MTKINELLGAYGKSYNWYYSHDYNEEKAYEICKKFDDRMKSDESFNKFVSKIAIVRGDLFTSDREVLAFMKAFSKLGGESLYSIPKEDYISEINHHDGWVWTSEYKEKAIESINNIQ